MALVEGQASVRLLGQRASCPLQERFRRFRRFRGFRRGRAGRPDPRLTRPLIGTTDSSGVCFWAEGERGGDEGVRGRRGRYLRKTWRNRGKNEVRLRAKRRGTMLKIRPVRKAGTVSDETVPARRLRHRGDHADADVIDVGQHPGWIFVVIFDFRHIHQLWVDKLQDNRVVNQCQRDKRLSLCGCGRGSSDALTASSSSQEACARPLPARGGLAAGCRSA